MCRFYSVVPGRTQRYRFTRSSLFPVPKHDNFTQRREPWTLGQNRCRQSTIISPPNPPLAASNQEEVAVRSNIFRVLPCTTHLHICRSPRTVTYCTKASHVKSVVDARKAPGNYIHEPPQGPSRSQQEVVAFVDCMCLAKSRTTTPHLSLIHI